MNTQTKKSGGRRGARVRAEEKHTITTKKGEKNDETAVHRWTKSAKKSEECHIRSEKKGVWCREMGTEKKSALANIFALCLYVCRNEVCAYVCVCLPTSWDTRWSHVRSCLHCRFLTKTPHARRSLYRFSKAKQPTSTPQDDTHMRPFRTRLECS